MQCHLDEGVAVLRSEVDRKHQTALGVVGVEVARDGVQEHARSLAPHLARARHVLQRQVEYLQREGRAVQSTHNAPPIVLVSELDERRPQTTRVHVALQVLRVEVIRLESPVLPKQLVDSLQD